MDTITLLLAFMALAMAGVTVHAWHLGNEKRDVAFLGTVGGLMGLGAMVSAWA